MPSFLPRWRCDDAPVLQVIVGCPLAVQQALASTASATPQLAVVIGRSGVVEGADLVVRVDDLRKARRACDVLVSLPTPRRDSLLDTSPSDLATIVRSGRGGDGLLLRRRGGSLVDASRQVGIPVVGARPHAMLVTPMRTSPAPLSRTSCVAKKVIVRLGLPTEPLPTARAQAPPVTLERACSAMLQDQLANIRGGVT